MIARTKREIAALREGGKRLASVLAAMRAEAKSGAQTKDLDMLAERLIRERGDIPALKGYRPSFAARPYPCTVCVAVNDEVVHGIPSENNRILEDGDVVGFDIVLSHQGLFVDAALTIVVGEGDPAAHRLVAATEEALYSGIQAARPGNHLFDISAAIERVGDRFGYGIVYEFGGHGVGLSVHEEPMVPNVGEAGKGPVLEKGMVLAIEPMFTEGTSGRVKVLPDGYTVVTKDGSRAAHFEHTILITESEPEILTRLS